MNAHVLGFPRMGKDRELKWVLERYWRGECPQSELLAVADELKRRHWDIQAEAGMDLLPVGDASLYDHMLDTTVMLGALPRRFRGKGAENPLKLYFDMARGDAEVGTRAMEMTKWFDTNYHYIVPELDPDTTFCRNDSLLERDMQAVLASGRVPKPVLVGPLTFLLLAKEFGGCSRWDHLEPIVDVYCEILGDLARLCPWIQLDEPVLCTDLSEEAVQAFPGVYARLKNAVGDGRILLATYFGTLDENLSMAAALPVDGLHVDLVCGEAQLEDVLRALPENMALSLGLVDGRNIWRADLDKAAARMLQARNVVGDERLLIASSCSLLHVPMDLDGEDTLVPEIRSWLAFAVQKCREIAALKATESKAAGLFEESRQALAQRAESPLVQDAGVQARVKALEPGMYRRKMPVQERAKIQKKRFKLPLFPTTTIGSFPQTTDIRATRLALRKGEISNEEYTLKMRAAIGEVVRQQETLGIDVLVHGEPERNDMVEYFGQQMQGFSFTRNGWVQSYGSRCVKPPIIHGDVARKKPMTVDWSRYAASITDLPMKGMLTGPVTILCWSFVRDDMPRSEVCSQIALAVRDEVADLEKAGVGIIQIDEAALREGMPLRESEQERYLRWAVDSFRLSASGVEDQTQVHSHMCYSEFNVIVDWVAQMDSDVISIEASRSGMELLEAFDAFEFPSDIGPGVYDIHSPRVPGVEELVGLLRKALKVIPAERLWVNPDCGLKTRAWPETLKSLRNMVKAARILREDYATDAEA